jgi:hypothetical protein
VTDNILLGDEPLAAIPATATAAEIKAPGHRRRPAWARSLAWPALLVAGARIGAGVLIERAALGLFGFVDFPPSAVFRPEKVSTVFGFTHWDAGIYLRIAQYGYQAKIPDDSAFFPAYPYLTRAVSDATSVSLEAAAVAVSWISLWFAVWGVMRLTATLFPGSRSWRAGALLAFFPVSVFLLAGYAESLYIALVAWSLVALAQRRPWLGALLAAAASVTRPEGVLIILAVVVWGAYDELFARRRRRWAAAVARVVGLGAVGSAALIAYLAFVWRRYGHVFEELSVNKQWHRQWTWPFHPLWSSLADILGDRLPGGRITANYVATYLVDDAAMVLAVAGLVALGVIVWRRRQLCWLLPPVALGILIIASDAPFGTSPEAWARYMMCLVPLYAVASRLKSDAVWTTLLAASAVFAALFQVLFNTGLWLT